MPDHWIWDDDMHPKHRKALSEAVMEMKEAARLLVKDQPVMAGVLRDKAIQLEDAFGFEVAPVEDD